MKSLASRELNWFQVLAIVAIAVLFFVAPFYKGLFNGNQFVFEGPIHWTLIGFSILMTLSGIYLFKSGVFNTHGHLISIVVWLIPFTYMISYFGAVAKHSAMMEVHIKILWAFLFGLGFYLARRKFGSKAIQYLFVASGYLLVIFGLMNWFSNVNYPDGVIWYFRRLANVFQYPNVYAAYLSVVYFGAVALLQTRRKWYVNIIASIMLTPILLSFLLTLSRAAMISLAVGFILFLMFFNLRRQIYLITYFVLSGLMALLLFNPVLELAVQLRSEYSVAESLKGWLLIIVGSCLVGVVISFLQVFVNKNDQSSETESLLDKKNFIIPLILLVLIFAVLILVFADSPVLNYLPEQIKNRVAGINSESSSLYQRNTFYKDASEIIKDNPLVGTGGSGWSVVYHAYKSYPYISNQAHNFYFQHTVETGLIGLVLLIVFLLYWFVFVIKYHIRQLRSSFDYGRVMFPVIAFVLLIHSFFDFDMSYVYISAVTFLMMGASVAGVEKPIGNAGKFIKANQLKFLCATGLIIIGALSLFYNAKALNANQLYKQLSKPMNVQEVTKHLNKALELMPKHPEYNLAKINVLMQMYTQSDDSSYQSEIDRAIQTAKKYNPYHAGLLELEFQYLMESGRYEDSLFSSIENTQIYPWDIKWYDRGIQLASQLGAISALDKRDQYWGHASNLAQEVQRKHATILELPQTEQGSADVFKINHVMAAHLAQIYFAQEKYHETIDLLKPYLTDQLDLNVHENYEIVRMYLSTVSKLNRKDAYWTDVLREYERVKNNEVEQ